MFNFIIKLIDSLVWPLVIVVVIWLAFFLNLRYHLDWNHFGMHPRQIEGLLGIFTMPFLHGDFDHLFSNTIPLLLSMGFIYLYFNEKKYSILIYNTLVTGGLLWIIGESGTNHIGASGLVYAFIFFMITHAFITRNKETMAASFVLIFLYGSLIYGIFPEYGQLIGKNISWEGHLSGALSGILFAFIYRKDGPQKKIYFENDEDDDDDDFEFWDNDDDLYHVNYHYHEKRED